MSVFVWIYNIQKQNECRGELSWQKSVLFSTARTKILSENMVYLCNYTLSFNSSESLHQRKTNLNQTLEQLVHLQ